jgi:hypothetical protein
MRLRLALPILLAAALLAVLGGCGGNGDGGGGGSDNPAEQVPEAGGLRTAIEAAQHPSKADFQAPGGRTLQEIADNIGGGQQEAALASSVFTVGTNRLAFGVIDQGAQFVYGKTAVYVARTPDSKARGPYVAPADVLMTQPPYRSKQAANEKDPFSAVYAAQVPFDRPGKWSVMTVTEVDGRQVAAPAQVDVVTRAQDKVPEVGERAPSVETDTVASARGDVASIDTRVPPDDMHDKSFADVLGKKPVALLFATPQLCQSRVCGPVVDIAAQLKSRYGDRMQFIHQEVYRDNDVNKGLRPPLERFRLPTEPWLFVVDADGRVTARLEGSFGVRAFDRAIQSAL